MYTGGWGVRVKWSISVNTGDGSVAGGSNKAGDTSGCPTELMHKIKHDDVRKTKSAILIV